MSTTWFFDGEGYVEVEGGRIWCGVVGNLDFDKAPLLIVHGGPGMSHHYLYPLCDLADERAVIFYDQLDAGQSDRPNDPSNWRVERFVSEIDDLRAALSLEQVSLLGNSWGGTIAAAYGASQPVGLVRLILSSPLLHTQTWLADNQAYRTALPSDVQAVMARFEESGDTGAVDYLGAVDQFYRQHFCRADPWPDYVQATFDRLNETCYRGMWGPNEFTCDGVLSAYDGTGGLPQIVVETLVTCGEFDEATAASCRHFAAMIPKARVRVFDDASHLAFVEQRDAFITTIRHFLRL